MTHTYTILDISQAAFDEIKAKFEAAEYHHAFDKDDEGLVIIDMRGIVRRAKPPESA